MDALKGIWLTLSTPRLWPFCLGPLFGAFLLYVALGVGGGFLLVPRLEEWFRDAPDWAKLAELGAVVVWIILFPFIFTLLGGVFFGLIFEPLSRAVEKLIASTDSEAPPSDVRLSAGVTFGDTIARLTLNGTLAFTAFLLGFFLGPIPGVIAAALVGLLDYTSPTYLRRGRTLGPQSRHLFSRLDGGTLAFALVAGLLSLVPLVGVLLMPGLIAGGTLLAHRRLDDKEA
jgi:CysZ protein